MGNRYKEIEERARNDYRDALNRLVRGIQTHTKLKGRRVKITPTVVALEARRSRNPLYTTHKELLKEIRDAAKQPTPEQKAATAEDKINELREDNKQLREDKRKLASENADLLYRLNSAEALLAQKDAEIAELLRKLNQAPVPVKRPE